MMMSRPSANPSIASRGSASPNSFNGSARGMSRPANMSPGASRPSMSFGNSRAPASLSFRSNSTAGGYYANGFSSRPRPLVEHTSSYSSGRQVQSLGSLPASSYASSRYSGPSGSNFHPDTRLRVAHFRRPGTLPRAVRSQPRIIRRRAARFRRPAKASPPLVTVFRAVEVVSEVVAAADSEAAAVAVAAIIANNQEGLGYV